MTVYQYLKENTEVLKGGFRCGFVSPTFLNYIEIMDCYFERKERGRKGSNPIEYVIFKFDIPINKFYRIKRKMLQEYK